MIADPAASTRPVFDFQGKCAGMVLGGDYWYFNGFDCTHSQNAQKGIQVSGNHNVLDNINTYHNGNTGLQISRLYSTDSREMWPSYNLILNCTIPLICSASIRKGSPNNPTGAVYTEASLAAVCRAVGDKPIFILCDDVYRGLCMRPCPDTAALPGLRERLLIAQSFSKPWR